MSGSPDTFQEESDAAVVLAVDDDAGSLDLMEVLLRPLGVAFVGAVSGREALHKLDALRPDVIVLDMMMPGMDGLQTMQHIKARPDCEDTPILIVTAVSGNKDLRVEALEKGADDFVCKPVCPEEIRARVRNMIKVRKYHAALQRQNLVLEKAVRSRTLDLERELAERRRLEIALLRAEDNERCRMGRELHDGIGQTLTGMTMMAKGLALDLKDANREEHVRADLLVNLAGQSKQFVRDLLDGLPMQLDSSANLIDGLVSLAAHTQSLFGIPCDYDVPDKSSVFELDMDTVRQVTCIVREALHNAAKHARPSRIHIRCRQEAACIMVMITDDGCGMSDSQNTTGMGMSIMRHRADMIGARIRFETSAGKGTRVMLELEVLP